jgi:NAD(P)H-hydrate epimerase
MSRSTTIVEQLPKLPPRLAASNKGSFGRVLVAAGCRGMSGAAVLCGSAALRGGAGLVRVAVPHEILPIVAAANPCYLTAPLPQDADGRIDRSALDPLLELIAASTVTAVGPGLGQGPGITELIGSLVERSDRPLVLDADALNAICPDPGRLLSRRAPVFLTPHPGEFARLLGRSVAEVQAQRQELAARFAADHGVIVVLKGHGTVVSDGRQLYVNPTGNPGMATGGTGDVLTGLIAALLAQGLDPFAASQLGVYWHGLAGDLARDDLGEIALIASDLLDYLPRAIQKS